MCGFVGLVSFSDDVSAVLSLDADSLARQAWRGPDGMGAWSDAHCHLHHSRLAVLDPGPEADQPLFDEQVGDAIVYNGEIYNFKHLARRHGCAGASLRSDTHLLRSLLRGSRSSSLAGELQGMYAFGYWDGGKRELTLARDPFGIKPLYYSIDGDRAIFGSDPWVIANIRSSLGHSTTVSEYALGAFLATGGVPPEGSMWREIRSVSPGEWVTIDVGGSVRMASALLPGGALGRGAASTFDDAGLVAALSDSVARHLVADVEVGAFLSGGLDSGLVVALAARHFGPGEVKTFSVGWDGLAIDEGPMAQAVAASLRTDHRHVGVAPSQLPRLTALAAEAFPQPVGDSAALPMLALSEEASRHVPVVLTGEGGDELFGGYRRYGTLSIVNRLSAGVLPLPEATKSLSGRWGRLARLLVAEPGLDRYLAAINADVSLELPIVRSALGQRTESVKAMASAGASKDPREIAAREMNFRLAAIYLNKVDRSTMRFGLEARVPFLDWQVVEAAASTPWQGVIAGRGSKPGLRRIAAQLLPQSVNRAGKRGLSYPLAAAAGTSYWEDVVSPLLRRPRIADAGVVQADAIRSIIQRSREAPYAQLSYRLTMLELWWRRAEEAKLVS